MKKPFMETVRARSPEEAFGQVGPRMGKTRWSLANDVPHDVRKAVLGKLRRVEENAALYPDKVEEYRKILEKFDAQQDPHKAVIDCLIEHGDIRVDNEASCAIRDVGGRQYIVFGYRFR